MVIKTQQYKFNVSLGLWHTTQLLPRNTKKIPLKIFIVTEKNRLSKRRRIKHLIWKFKDNRRNSIMFLWFQENLAYAFPGKIMKRIVFKKNQ